VLRAEELHEDMYAAIDLITDKLERQIRKHKTKVNRKFREKESLKDYAPIFTEVEQVEEDEDLEVVRTKSFDLKPMDSEEAILQMNMLGHSFYVFTNAETNQTNVVYKRNDGRYGLIEAQ
jgi:putative sigma-54 modulation protein